jgi:hypothetical protein
MSVVDRAGVAADDNKWRRHRAALDGSGQHHRRPYSWKKTERSLTVFLIFPDDQAGMDQSWPPTTAVARKLAARAWHLLAGAEHAAAPQPAAPQTAAL